MISENEPGTAIEALNTPPREPLPMSQATKIVLGTVVVSVLLSLGVIIALALA